MENTDSAHRQHHYTAYINIVLFILTLLFGGLGQLMPNHSYLQNVFWEIANACFISGCTLSSVQLADRKWIIPAAGFILMSISFIGFFSLIPVDTPEKLNEVAKNVIIMLPAMGMICYYKAFPVWVRTFGVITCFPFITILFLAHSGLDDSLFRMLFGFGYFFIQTTALFWGIYFLRNLRRDAKEKFIE